MAEETFEPDECAVKAQGIPDLESLEVSMKVGMQFKAMYSCRCGNPSCDEELHPASIVQVSHNKKRAKAPVKVSYTGYDEEHDAWVGLDKVILST